MTDNEKLLMITRMFIRYQAQINDEYKHSPQKINLHSSPADQVRTFFEASARKKLVNQLIGEFNDIIK